MSFSRIELQALAAKANYEIDHAGNGLMRCAYFDLFIAAEYLNDLMARQLNQPPLSNGFSDHVQ